MQDLKYIFSVKSFVLNAVGKFRNLESIFLLNIGFTCVTFTTGALAYYAPVYFETGIESLGKGCPGYNPDLEPFDKGSVNFVIGAITAGAGGNSLFGFELLALHP